MGARIIGWIDLAQWSSRVEAEGVEGAALALGSIIVDFMSGRFNDDSLPDGVGVLGRQHPTMLETSAARVLMWSHGTIVEVDVDVDVDAASVREWLSLEGDTLSDGAKAQLFVADWDVLGAFNHDDIGAVISLGRQMLQTLGQPGGTRLSGNAAIAESGPAVPLYGSCVIVYARYELMLLEDLDPATRERIVESLIEPRGGSLAADNPSDAAPVLQGFLLEASSDSPDVFIPAGPGSTTVLFGRNGAGKTLLLEAVLNRLAIAHKSAASLTKQVDSLPKVTILLDAKSQERAPRLFTLLFAHIGWSPYGPLSPLARRRINQVIPSWSSIDDRPETAEGLKVSELAGRPLAELRDAVRAATLSQSVWGADDAVGYLIDLLLRGSCLALDSSGRVGLAVDFDRPTGEDQRAAQRLLEPEFRQRAAGRILEGVDLLLLQVAEGIIGERRTPLVSLPCWVGSGLPEGYRFGDSSEWPKIGDELLAQLVDALPVPVVYDRGESGRQEASGRAEEATLRVLDSFGRRAKGGSAEEHPFHNDPLLDPVLAALATRANQLLPRFVSEQWQLEIRKSPPSQWHRHRLTVALNNTSRTESLDTAPAGVRSWGLAALRFAEADLLACSWTASTEPRKELATIGPKVLRVRLPSSMEVTRGSFFERAEPETLRPDTDQPRNLLFFLDEPEAHLHVTAQEDVARLVQNIAQASSGALVATHALAFLDNPSQSSTVITLARDGNALVASQAGGLAELLDRADSLGIRRSALAQTCRAVLFVEGKNDERVLRRYAGIDFDREFILISILQGHEGARTAAEFEFVNQLRVPAVILLDHVNSDLLEEMLNNRGRVRNPRGEIKTLEVLDEALRKRNRSAISLTFDGLDIVCAIPGREIGAALERLGGLKWQGWRTVNDEADRRWKQNREKFKDVFSDLTGFSVERVIDECVDNGEGDVSPVLKGILSKLTEELKRDGGIRPELLRPGLHPI
jgi:energy-coupling factor transporter ATP-binding protein EcfA2